MIFFIILLFLWSAVITFFLLRTISHYNRLTGRTGGSVTLREVLDSLMSRQDKSAKDIAALRDSIARIENDGRFHFQQLGIVRYNPFSDTGGSQSFTLALLDGHDNGIIMTSLYARTGNRWYIKHVKNGTGEDVELSKEEQTAIRKAKPVSELSSS